VEFLREIEGKPLFFGVGLLAASVGGEENPARGVVEDLDVYLALEVRRVVEKEAGDGGWSVEEILNAELSSASARRRASKLPPGSLLQTETRVL
jgi:hypothetical protein